MSATHDATIQHILELNPGVRFGVPDGFYGNRPIYITDGPGQAARIAARAWLMDPEGFAGTTNDFRTNGWTILPAPTDATVFGQPWLLPASTGPGNSPDDIVASWGYADQGAMVWYDVRRNGVLTPYLAGTGLPPAWALAQSPYQASQFDLTRSQQSAPATTTTTTTTPSTPAQSTTPTTPAGTPITGNAADRYLVNGVLYDGLGQVVAQSTSAHVVAAEGGTPGLLVAGGLAALWFLSRKQRRS